MQFGWDEIHDTIDEFYDDQRRLIWEPKSLLKSINKGLETQQEYINDIEISEDCHEHRTIIKIVINERKYLIRRMISPEFDLENFIRLTLNERLNTLNPLIKITIE